MDCINPSTSAHFARIAMESGIGNYAAKAVPAGHGDWPQDSVNCVNFDGIPRKVERKDDIAQSHKESALAAKPLVNFRIPTAATPERCNPLAAEGGLFVALCEIFLFFR